MPAAYDEVAMTQPVPTPPVPTPIPSPGDPAIPPAPQDDPLRPEGIRALQAERERVAAMEKEFAPFRDLARALAGGKVPAEKTEIDLINERLAAQDKVIADQAVQLLRSDVAEAKGLTKSQAALLVGKTTQELAAHADLLIAEFGKPAAPDPKVRPGMRPDPAQGAQPGAKPSAKDKGAAEALKRFGPRPTT